MIQLADLTVKYLESVDGGGDDDVINRIIDKVNEIAGRVNVLTGILAQSKGVRKDGKLT